MLAGGVIADTWGLTTAAVAFGVVASSLSHLVRMNWGTSLYFGGIWVGAASIAGMLQALRWSWEPWLAPGFGRFSDGKMHRAKVLTLMLLAAAFLLGVMPFRMPIWLWMLAVGGMQITATALTTIGDAAAADAAVNQSRTTVMTLYVMATDIGAALGPLIGYLMADLWGIGSIYWATSGLLATLALWWFSGNRQSASVA